MAGRSPVPTYMCAPGGGRARGVSPAASSPGPCQRRALVCVSGYCWPKNLDRPTSGRNEEENRCGRGNWWPGLICALLVACSGSGRSETRATAAEPCLRRRHGAGTGAGRYRLRRGARHAGRRHARVPRCAVCRRRIRRARTANARPRRSPRAAFKSAPTRPARRPFWPAARTACISTSGRAPATRGRRCRCWCSSMAAAISRE